MRVLICGSRTWESKHPIGIVLRGLKEAAVSAGQPLELVHGAAPGADSVASELGEHIADAVIPIPADWKAHGRAAGPLRNQKMLDKHRPDVVYAFRCAGKSNGTDDMIRRSRAEGIPVFLVQEVE